jgi:hypothetical protein
VEDGRDDRRMEVKGWSLGGGWSRYEGGLCREERREGLCGERIGRSETVSSSEVYRPWFVYFHVDGPNPNTDKNVDHQVSMRGWGQDG